MTKEEIILSVIGPSYPSFQEYLKLASPKKAESKVHDIMDRWVRKYREKLKAKVKDLHSEDNLNIAEIFKTIDSL